MTSAARPPRLGLLSARVGLSVLGCLWPSVTWAEDPPPASGGAPAAEEPTAYDEPVVVVGSHSDPAPSMPAGRSVSTTDKEDFERRLPRSAPDALRFEPGVFVQQTGHGQGSPFIRGLTGQETLLLFDGIRLNNSTFRQGPNQYFFTLDAASLKSIEVLRGGGSTRWGSDALGGALLAHPQEPSLPSPASDRALTLWPQLSLRAASADKELGGRLESNLTIGDRIAVFAGIGGRRAGLLEGGGAVAGLTDGAPSLVPRLAEDGRTQLGTGFQELTGDVRLLYRLSSHHDLKVAGYAYRQFDAPRTDQCPPPLAPLDECLTYEEQFRTLLYLAWEAKDLGPLAKTARGTVSWQRQHERRNLSRPSASVSHLGRDDVDTLGATLTMATTAFRLSDVLRLSTMYGAELYLDRLASLAWISFLDVGYVEQRSRGQYLDGSTYGTGGAFVLATATLWQELRARLGARLGLTAADAPGDPNSGSQPIAKSWLPSSATLGLEWRPSGELSLMASVDRSFRTPNLDDLTSRQQTGPGFQFENPSLGPESALTVELGARVFSVVHLEVWVFRTWVQDAIARVPREAAACPPNTPECETAWTRFTLVNAQSPSEITGVEALFKANLPWHLRLRGTVAYVFGEGPNPGERPMDPATSYQDRVPLSRIPPFNGTFELTFSPPLAFEIGSALRFAGPQDRLAIADRSDPRIPPGGTPGYLVLDLRFAVHLDRWLSLALVAENIFDAAYRSHGSSVNGPGRGIVAWVSLSP